MKKPMPRVCCDCKQEFAAKWAVQKRCPECADKKNAPIRTVLKCADCQAEFIRVGVKTCCDTCQERRATELGKRVAKRRRQRNKKRFKEDAVYREQVLAEWRERDRKWRAKNPDKRADQKRRDREKNRERVRQYKREYDRRTRAANPVVRLVARTRSRIAMALREVREGRAVTSKGQAFQLLGCTVEHFVRHLESQFADGMTWETFAGRDGWHVDHIYPIAAADLADEAHRLAVFNWRNCRPQWGVENLKKGATVTDEAADLFQSLLAEFKQRLPNAGRAAG